VNGTEERLQTILHGWKNRHGREVMRTRGTKMLTVVNVAYEDGTTGRLTRGDFGPWEIERSPDKSPPKTDPVTISRAEHLECPNLRASLHKP